MPAPSFYTCGSRLAAITLLVLAFALSALAQPTRPDWFSATQAGPGTIASATWVDAHGNTYLLGSAGPNPTAFGSIPVNHAGTVLAKADATGNWQWVQPLPTIVGGPASFLNLYRLTGDGQGGLYMAGRFAGTVTFSPSITLTAVGLAAGLLARYDTAGTLQWVRQIPGSLTHARAYDMAIQGLAADAQGNGYVTWPLISDLDFGASHLHPTNARTDVAVAKINAQGIWQWANQSTGTADEAPTGLGVDRQGNAYVGGVLSCYTDFGQPTTDTTGQFGATHLGVPITVVGSSIPIPLLEGFVAKLSPNGQWLWARQTRGAGSTIQHVCVSPTGDTFVEGTTAAFARFGTLSPVVLGLPYFQYYVAKVSANGIWRWVRAVNGGDYIARDLKTTPAGDGVLLTGNFTDSLLVGNALVPADTASFGSHRLFAAGIDSAGSSAWALASQNNGGYYVAQGESIGADARGNVYVAGNFTNRLQLGSLLMLNTDSLTNAVVLARISPMGTTGFGAPLAGPGTEVFPNPARVGQVVEWALPGPAIGAVSLQNMLGQRVYAAPASGALLRLPTAALVAGVYLLRVEAGGRTICRRLVVD